ncbi:MAG TPA: hypothetical protein VJL84_05240 [Kiloniellales bacterium]|nr:hypothetical protein [Kiloniellales bacterium]
MARLLAALLLALVLVLPRDAAAETDCGPMIEAGDEAAILAFVQKYEYTNPLLRFNFWIPELGRAEGDAGRLAECLARLDLLFAEGFAGDPGAARRYSDLSWFLGYVNYFGLRAQPAFGDVRAHAHDAILAMSDRRLCDITKVLYLKYFAAMLLEYELAPLLLGDLLPELPHRLFYARMADMAGCGDPGAAVMALRLLLAG